VWDNRRPSYSDEARQKVLGISGTTGQGSAFQLSSHVSGHQNLLHERPESCLAREIEVSANGLKLLNCLPGDLHHRGDSRDLLTHISSFFVGKQPGALGAKRERCNSGLWSCRPCVLHCHPCEIFTCSEELLWSLLSRGQVHALLVYPVDCCRSVSSCCPRLCSVHAVGSW